MYAWPFLRYRIFTENLSGCFLEKINQIFFQEDTIAFHGLEGMVRSEAFLGESAMGTLGNLTFNKSRKVEKFYNEVLMVEGGIPWTFMMKTMLSSPSEDASCLAVILAFESLTLETCKEGLEDF